MPGPHELDHLVGQPVDPASRGREQVLDPGDHTISATLEGHQPFEKKLQLVGVGYRAQAKGKVLNLNLGFSHPIDYAVPEGIKIDTPSQTEVVVGGADKQVVGQVAAEIRGFRPPEPYKGKGIRYVGERIGWHYGFGLAGIGMVFGLLVYLPYSKFAHILYRTLAMTHERMTRQAA